MTIVWHGEEVIPKIEKMVDKRIRLAAATVANHARKKLNRGQPTAGTGTDKRGLQPSKPGEYPKKVLGQLRDDVGWEYDEDEKVARVGANVKHGLFLESGTRLMKRRPWLSRALFEMRSTIKRILGGGRR